MMSRVHVAILLALSATGVGFAQASPQVDSDEGPSPIIPVTSASPATLTAAPVLNENRIFGVIPDYQTVTDTGSGVIPLTGKQKWSLALKETVDPFNLLNAALGAAFSQRGNQTPKYGEGGVAYGQRFAAAFLDFGSQNFFSAGVLATVMHQDPRYYRKGEGTSIPKRVVYSISRLVIAQQDSGASAFNASGIGGMMMGIAASNLYYPVASRHLEVMTCRISTSLTGGIMGNLMSEFWPDLQKKFFHKKQ